MSGDSGNTPLRDCAESKTDHREDKRMAMSGAHGLKVIAFSDFSDAFDAFFGPQQHDAHCAQYRGFWSVLGRLPIASAVSYLVRKGRYDMIPQYRRRC